MLHSLYNGRHSFSCPLRGWSCFTFHVFKWPLLLSAAAYTAVSEREEVKQCFYCYELNMIFRLCLWQMTLFLWLATSRIHAKPQERKEKWKIKRTSYFASYCNLARSVIKSCLWSHIVSVTVQHSCQWRIFKSTDLTHSLGCSLTHSLTHSQAREKAWFWCPTIRLFCSIVRCFEALIELRSSSNVQPSGKRAVSTDHDLITVWPRSDHSHVRSFRWYAY